MALRIMLAMIIGGGFLAWFGIREARLASGASAEPTTISCAQLAANGPGDNAHIVLTDFLLCDFAFVYVAPENSSNWSRVWVPAVPLDGPYVQQLASMLKPDGTIEGEMPIPSDIRVIVKSAEVPTEAEMTRLADGDTIQGMVINRVSSLGSDERRILSESYPGVNFDNVYILEHNRKPSSAGFSYGMMGLGGLMSLGGVGLAVRRRAMRTA